MSMKLIIDIHEEQYEFIKQGMTFRKVTQFPALMESICEYITHGTPLDDVKAEIADLPDYMFEVYKLKSRVLYMLDNIGKADIRTNRKNCEYRHENGNCLKVGGFCTNVDDEHCAKTLEILDNIGKADMRGKADGNKNELTKEYIKEQIEEYSRFLDTGIIDEACDD